MRNSKIFKNGFTLIELLAIIVILAIIAVITVPIILNIIENSRKGTSIDSAYGYKDSVQKYYLTKSISDDTIDPVYGMETVKTVEQLETDGLTVSGDKPTEGWVHLNKGQVVDYSLKFGDYVVSFDSTTNAPISTKNGELKAQPVLELTMDYMCPDCVYKFVQYGDQYFLHIGDELTENDYVEDYNELGKNVFVGLKLDGNSKIEKAYSCGIEKNKPFCIEGYNTDSSVYPKNMNILTSIFGDTWDETTYKGCHMVEDWFDCTGDEVGAGFPIGDYNGFVDTYNFDPSDFMVVEPDGNIWNNLG